MEPRELYHNRQDPTQLEALFRESNLGPGHTPYVTLYSLSVDTDQNILDIYAKAVNQI